MDAHSSILARQYYCRATGNQRHPPSNNDAEAVSFSATGGKTLTVSALVCLNSDIFLLFFLKMFVIVLFFYLKFATAKGIHCEKRPANLKHSANAILFFPRFGYRSSSDVSLRLWSVLIVSVLYAVNVYLTCCGCSLHFCVFICCKTLRRFPVECGWKYVKNLLKVYTLARTRACSHNKQLKRDNINI